MKYPEQIMAKLRESGLTDEQIDQGTPRQVFDFMLAQHGLAGWGDFLSSLALATIAAPEPDPYEHFKPGAPIDIALGLVVDEYHDCKDARLAEEKRVKPLKERETELREFIIANLEKGEGKGAVGNRYKAIITEKRQPKIEEEGWSKLHPWIRENDRFDLLAKSLNKSAVMDLYEKGELPPGIETLLVPSVSVTKI